MDGRCRCTCSPPVFLLHINLTKTFVLIYNSADDSTLFSFFSSVNLPVQESNKQMHSINKVLHELLMGALEIWLILTLQRPNRLLREN